MPDISKFRKNLSESEFRTTYDDALQRERGIFNQNDFKNAWGSYSTKLPRDIGGRKDTSGSVFNPVDKLKGAIVGGIQTQEQTGYMPRLSEEMIKTSELADGFFNTLKNIKDPLKLLESGLEGLAGQAELYLTQQTELLGIINKQAGLTGQFSEDVRAELTMANVPLVRLGIGFEDLADAAKNLVSESGRFITLNRDSWYDAGEAATAYVGTLSELVSMYPSFEKIGIGASDVAKQIEKTGSRSLSLGLQSSKTTKELSTNLSKLNEFGFKNGVQGLSEMVRKSAEFRMNMDQVFKIAEEVMDPEKAISLSANLAVLGGAMGSFGDPLKMMYDATNNVEGLQDALIGAAGSLATYNSEQGRFEITGVNLRRAKAMAQELGISYTELANGAIASAERTSAATALMGRGLKLDDDQQRFLTNISQMKDGQMTIELNSERLQQVLGVDSSVREIALEKLTQTQVDTILKYQDEFKKLSPEEIIQKQATDVEQIGRNVSFLAAAARVRVAQSGGGMLDKIKEMVGYDPGDMRKTTNQLTEMVAKPLGFSINEQNTKGKMEPLESVKIDQTTKKTEENNNSNVQPMTKSDMVVALLEVHNATKNEKNRTITINNELQPIEPNDYRSIKIK
jgi:hypothetical protein